MIPFVDLARQHRALKAEMMAAVERVIDSTRFVLGREGEALEAELAALAGVRHAVGVASGTDALRLALAALDVGPGDEVITPAFSFVASSSTIVMTGATPVFVDIDPATFTLDPAAVDRAVTAKTKAVMPVHLYGHPAAMAEVAAVARAHDLAIVEDAAQAIGATWKLGRRRLPVLLPDEKSRRVWGCRDDPDEP
jgi:dTDP-4-amino-4,6-dideoxygalactose transaminase